MKKKKELHFTDKQHDDIMLHMQRNEMQGCYSGVARDFANLFGCKKQDIIDYYESHKNDVVENYYGFHDYYGFHVSDCENVIGAEYTDNNGVPIYDGVYAWHCILHPERVAMRFIMVDGKRTNQIDQEAFCKLCDGCKDYKKRTTV